VKRAMAGEYKRRTRRPLYWTASDALRRTTYH
jgi:hypothetical protein